MDSLIPISGEHHQSLNLILQPTLLHVLMVVTVLVTAVIVIMLGSDLVYGLGEDGVSGDDVELQDLPQDILSEGREEEELKLLGQLLERVGGRYESGDSGSTDKDGVMLFLGKLSRELPGDRTGSSNLLNGGGEGIEITAEEDRVQDGRRGQEGVIDLVQVSVDGLPVRVSGNDLGVKVQLEGRRNKVLLDSQSKRLSVVRSKLGDKGGSDGLVVSQLSSSNGLGKSVVLQDLSQDELEDPLLPLLVLVVIVVVLSEEGLTVKRVDVQKGVERRVLDEGVHRGGKRGVVLVTVVRRVGNSRVFYKERVRSSKRT